MKVSPPVEVCIVGGGVASSLLAFELASHGIEVLILEAGPRHDPAKRYDYMKQTLYGIKPWASNNPERDCFATGGDYFINLNSERVKAIGGAGLHWGGNVDRLHESDFELHSRYGLGVDWPIHYRELEPYYARAEKVMGVAGQDFYPGAPWRSEPYPMPPFPFSYSDKILQPAFDRLGIPLHHKAVARNSVPYDDRPACMSFGVCSACPIFAKWTPEQLINKAEKTGKVTVKPNTRVTRINCDKSGSAIETVTAVSVVDGRSSELKYEANIFILAAHAVESARLLLLSGCPSHPHGLGNNGGCVGKYFMEHISLDMAAELKEKTYPERIGFETACSFYFYERSRKAGQNAYVLGVNNRYVSSPVDIAKEELKREVIWGEKLATAIRERHGYTASIGAMIEQLPYEENRIALDETLIDDIGLPAPRIIYSMDHERELRTVAKVKTVISELFTTLKASTIRVTALGASSHHIGVCRMGDDEKSGVVDRDVKVHGVDNLYIAGSSVFPTCGAVPPTLTIAAFALRLADHLCSKLERSTENVGGHDNAPSPAVQQMRG